MLLDAAEQLMVEHDPLTVTLEQVAQNAGTSRPLLHAYFGDRRGLLDSVQARIIRRLDTWVGHGLSRATTSTASLQAIVTGLLSFVEQDRDVWSLLSASGGFDHPALHGLRSRWVDHIEGGEADRNLAASAVVSALIFGSGGWVARGLEADDVIEVLARCLPTPDPLA